MKPVRKAPARGPAAPPPPPPELRPGQSIELLQHLHLLTRDGKLNQDARRKLKQVDHLVQFIDKGLRELTPVDPALGPLLADHGAVEPAPGVGDHGGVVG